MAVGELERFGPCVYIYTLYIYTHYIYIYMYAIILIFVFITQLIKFERFSARLLKQRGNGGVVL